MTTLAFRRMTEGSEDDTRWGEISDPPYLTAYGQDDFVELPDVAGLCAYVNGVRVAGRFQVVLPGDFVRVVCGGREVVSYRFAGRHPGGAEPGRGRRCAFTRMPIEGTAVSCDCGRLSSTRVVEQIGTCVCDRALRPDCKTPSPAEELL